MIYAKAISHDEVCICVCECRDDGYNEWYDVEHFKDLLAVPGVVSDRRLQVSPNPLPPATHRI
jgi:hypothetical protein